MFKKVNSKFSYSFLISIEFVIFRYTNSIASEDIVGFYSSGPKLKENDLKVYNVAEKCHQLIFYL
jgi:hypothetical protein